MAGKNWQAGGKGRIPAAALACLLVLLASCFAASAAPELAADTASPRLDPNTVREILMAGLAIVLFLAAIIVWAMTAVRGAQRSQRRNANFVSSALNSL